MTLEVLVNDVKVFRFTQHLYHPFLIGCMYGFSDVPTFVLYKSCTSGTRLITKIDGKSDKGYRFPLWGK